jgi:hypothetical protein
MAIRDGRTPQDVLYRLLLKSGFTLTTKIETLKFDLGSGFRMTSPEGTIDVLPVVITTE